MASTRKTANTKSKLQPQRPTAKKPQAAESQDIESLRRELAEAGDQQAATSEVLRLIAHSPTELDTLLNAIAESAARVCGAEDASVRLVDGDVLRLLAHVGPIPSTVIDLPIAEEPLNQHVLRSGETVHIQDILAEKDPMSAPTRARLQTLFFLEFRC